MVDLDSLGASLGLAPTAFRFLVGVLLGFPLSLIFQVVIRHVKSTSVKHVYSALSGLFLGVFCFGPSMVHLVNAAAGTYVLMAVLPRRSAVAMQLPIFLFNMGYLLTEYYYVSSAETYDIDFTTAHCVLTLRLIGLGWDYVDGADSGPHTAAKRPSPGADSTTATTPAPSPFPSPATSRTSSPAPEPAAPSPKKNALIALPSLLEIFGYAFHWGGFLVGPQFPFRVYSNFITGKGENVQPPSQGIPWAVVAKTFGLGVVYLGLSSAIGSRFPISFVVDDKFLGLSFLERVGYLWISTRLRIYTYVGIWMLTDGHCILSGLGYHGVDDKGRAKWDRVTNFLPWMFDTATSLHDYVLSFNINTNTWVKEYIFKRLRFLGSKELSSLASLVFLAIWHGFAPGYFITFFLEFIMLMTETKLRRLLLPIRTHRLYKTPVGHTCGFVFALLLSSLACSYGFVSFEVKTLDKSYRALSSVHWFGLIFMGCVFLLDFLFGRRIKRAFPAEKSEDTKRE